MAFFTGINRLNRLEGYAHVGQHFEANIEYYYNDTVPAKKEEYLPLLNELNNVVGYSDLVVVKRGVLK